MAKKSKVSQETIYYWILLGLLALMCLAIIVLFKNYDRDKVNKIYFKPFEERHHARYGTPKPY